MGSEGAGRNARVMQRDRRIVIPGEPTCETRDPGTQAKEVYWVPALQNRARAISPAGMTNDGMPTRQPTLCLSLATLVPGLRQPKGFGRGGGSRPQATGQRERRPVLFCWRVPTPTVDPLGSRRNARVMQHHRRIVIPGEPTCETRDPDSRAISLLGPGSPKLRTRNFSGRDDKRWNAHAPTDSLLGACDSRSCLRPQPAASDGPTRTAAGSAKSESP